MEATILLLIVIGAALLAYLFVSVFSKRTNSSCNDSATDYAEGLNFLLAGEKEKAIRKLKEAVRKNTKLVDAYIKIGDIFRELGEPVRAISIHKYLTVRKNLSDKQRNEILQSLTLDFRTAGHFDQALEVLEKVLESDKKAHWAREMKVRVYEDLADWAGAFVACKDLPPAEREKVNSRQAVYKVREGLQLIKKGASEKDAIVCFKEAIKIDPEGSPGYIALANSYNREKRKDEALKTLKLLVEKIPDQSKVAFHRIKELLYDGGVYGEIENICYDILKRQPENIIARLALVETYDKKGELEKAISECLLILDREPENEETLKYLVWLYHKSGDDSKALQIALELLGDLPNVDEPELKLDSSIEKDYEN